MNKRYKVYGVDANSDVWDIYSYNNKKDALAQAKKSKRSFDGENEYIYIQDSKIDRTIKVVF